MADDVQISAMQTMVYSATDKRSEPMAELPRRQHVIRAGVQVASRLGKSAGGQADLQLLAVIPSSAGRGATSRYVVVFLGSAGRVGEWSVHEKPRGSVAFSSRSSAHDSIR